MWSLSVEEENKKEMAGAEGEGKDWKWHLLEAVVCVRAMGMSIAVTEHVLVA